MASRVSSRYAKSLISLATELKVLEEVHNDAKSILSDLSTSAELTSMFRSPIISVEKKHSIVSEIYNGKAQQLTVQFLTLLISKKRESGIVDILSSFVEQYRSQKQIGTLTIISASSLTPELKDKLTSEVKVAMGMQDMVVEEKVDQDLIGGFILEYDNKRYDATVKNALERIESSFNKNLYLENY